MKLKLLHTLFVGLAISSGSSSVLAEESSNQKFPKIAFVCGTQANQPTMYAYTPGQTALEPLMSWHPEYLLPEQSGKQTCLKTAAKLQASYEQKEAKYLKAEKSSVCLVNQEQENCTAEGSKALFSVNPDYEAGCVLDNIQPLECKALSSTRGNIYSFENEPYQPIWWPW